MPSQLSAASFVVSRRFLGHDFRRELRPLTKPVVYVSSLFSTVAFCFEPGLAVHMVLPRKRKWSRQPSRCNVAVEPLADDEFDSKHEICKDPNCVQCLFKNHLQRFRAAAALSCNAGLTWLLHKVTGVGCVVCSGAGYLHDTFGSFKGGVAALKIHALKRHCSSVQHRNAENTLTDKAFSTVYKTPSVQDFEKLWGDVRGGFAYLGGFSASLTASHRQ